MDFPDLVYRGFGPYQRKGGGWSFRQVNNNEELNSFLADNWHTSLEAAIEFHDNEQVKESGKPLTRAEIEVLAKDAGIKFNGRTPDKALHEKVTAWVTAKGSS